MPDFASRLVFVRGLAEDISQGELGMLCGLNRSHVRLLETRARVSPEVHTITRIASTLDVPFLWLAMGEGDAPAAETVRAAVARARKRARRARKAA